MKKILCPGEALIDLFGVETKSLTECTTFEKSRRGPRKCGIYDEAAWS